MFWYIFVEGAKDEAFFNRICGQEFIKLIPYAKKKKEYVDNYIKSIKNMPDSNYILIADTDTKEKSLAQGEILDTFKQCDIDHLSMVICEIESWLVAGLDSKTCQKNKIRYERNTEGITKETFNNYFPEEEPYGKIIELLAYFKSMEAITRNQSFKEFYEKYRYESFLAL